MKNRKVADVGQNGIFMNALLIPNSHLAFVVFDFRQIVFNEILLVVGGPTAPFLLLFLPRTKKVIILEYSYKKQMKHPLIISGILSEQ